MIQVNALERTSEDKRGDRRQKLRDFQSQLLDRVQAARSSVVVSSNQLGVMIGQDHYLLNLQDAGEIISMGTIAEVPLTRDWYLGLLNLRGNLIGVIDIQRFRGKPPVEVNSDCKIVAFSTRLTFNAGLLVSKVLGLRDVAEMTLQESAMADSGEWLQRSYLDEGGQSWLELSLNNLVHNSDFLHIGI